MRQVIASLFIAAIASIAAASPTSPEMLDIKVHNYYKKRTDGQPGRSIVLKYSGKRSLKGAKVEIAAGNTVEITEIKHLPSDSVEILLPAATGVTSTDTITASIVWKGHSISCPAVIPAMRHWTVYIYPHSHVDIGYTNTHENVEFIHKRNLDVAIKLAAKTAIYPEEARFKWNPEVIWPVERYMKSESKEKRERLIAAIQDGTIALDAGYVNTNTSASSDEELLKLFEIERLTGKPIRAMVQIDIPGMSWGTVTAANMMGVDYILSLFNGSGRIGTSHKLSFRPFRWIGPDGKSEVLFLQPGSYAPGAQIKGKYFWPSLAGQLDRSKLFPIIKTDNPRENFIDPYLDEMLPQLENDKEYPYDIFPMTWCMADNTPIDTDLPDAIKSWNEEYAFPHLRICTATELMQAFESRWGDSLPVMKGDFTEYWTDGLGSSAQKTGESREVKERLVQGEILWSMLSDNAEEPRDLTSEAWRNMILSTEHTWAFMDPVKDEFQQPILKSKSGYFDRAKELTDSLVKMSYAAIEDKSSSRITVFNTENHAKSGIALLPADIDRTYNRVIDSGGKEAEVQRLTNGQLAFHAENVAPLGCRDYLLKRGKPDMTHTKAHTAPNVLDNGIVKVEVDPVTGDIVSLLFNGEEFVNNESTANINSFRYLEGDKSSGYALKPYDIKIRKGEQGPPINSILVDDKLHNA